MTEDTGKKNTGQKTQDQKIKYRRDIKQKTRKRTI